MDKTCFNFSKFTAKEFPIFHFSSYSQPIQTGHYCRCVYYNFPYASSGHVCVRSLLAAPRPFLSSVLRPRFCLPFVTFTGTRNPHTTSRRSIAIPQTQNYHHVPSSSTQSRHSHPRPVPKGRSFRPFLSLGLARPGLHKPRWIHLPFHLPSGTSRHVLRPRTPHFPIH